LCCLRESAKSVSLKHLPEAVRGRAIDADLLGIAMSGVAAGAAHPTTRNL
jgi:hypothetical protein